MVKRDSAGGGNAASKRWKWKMEGRGESARFLRRSKRAGAVLAEGAKKLSSKDFFTHFFCDFAFLQLFPN